MNFLLFRGMMRDVRHWGGFVDMFAECFDSSIILTPDLPGLGVEHEHPTPLSITENVHFLRDKWAHQLDEGEWCVVGLSLGAMVALKWCELFPDDFQKVVVINTSSTLSPFWQRFKPSAFGTLLSCFFSRDLRKREAGILSLSSNLNEQDSVLLEQWCQFAKENAVSRTCFLRQLWAARQFNLARVKPVTLVLTSQADRLVNPRCSIRIAEFLDAKVRFHQRAGHDLPLDAPDWVIDQIQQFVAADRT